MDLRGGNRYDCGPGRQCMVPNFDGVQQHGNDDGSRGAEREQQNGDDEDGSQAAGRCYAAFFELE